MVNGEMLLRRLKLSIYEVVTPTEDCCKVNVVECHKGIFLLNLLNHKEPLIHSSAKHC
jgi:hypothetical protein